MTEICVLCGIFSRWGERSTGHQAEREEGRKEPCKEGRRRVQKLKALKQESPGFAILLRISTGNKVVIMQMSAGLNAKVLSYYHLCKRREAGKNLLCSAARKAVFHGQV